jgi:propanol-preferring alcohol dehydrogenase
MGHGTCCMHLASHDSISNGAQNQGKVVINDVPVPELGSGQVLIKVVAASLCHSDLMDLHPPGSSITIGHEGVGVIEKLHPSAEGKGFKVGDRVGCLYWNGCCYECEGCNHHQFHCKQGFKLLGGGVDGFFAEYAALDVSNLVKLPESIDMTKYSPVFCAGITVSLPSCFQSLAHKDRLSIPLIPAS